jgi:hypothetical protein
MSNVWRTIKHAYNRFPRTAAAGSLSSGRVPPHAHDCGRHPPITRNNSSRGMCIWTDIVDWAGGYPFEVASREKIIDFYERRGFHLVRLVSCGRRLGCNQYVLVRTSRTDDVCSCASQGLIAVQTQCGGRSENRVFLSPADSSMATICSRVNRFSNLVPKRSSASVRMK